jgi:MoaA/NifB/PqqE/SkfB family radical SAM enzyme
MKTIRYLHYRLQWFLARWTGKLVHVDIELNNNCNQKCISCWHHAPGKLPFKIGSISKENAKFHLSNFRKYGALSCKLNLRGEPLLYRNIDEVILFASRLGYVDIMINTNGVLLNSDMIHRLNASGLTTCIISVDSWNRNLYSNLHGVPPAEHDLLLSNLAYLRWMQRIGSLKFKVVLNYHVNRFNENESDSFYREHFSDFKLVKRKTERRHGADITLSKKHRNRKKNCPHAMRRIAVTVEGHKYPCCVCYDNPADIRFNDFIKDREKFIKRYRSGDIPKTCRNCTSGDIWK